MAAARDEPVQRPVWLVAVAAWAVPGLGHAMVGQAWRGIAIAAAVVSLFVGGLLIGGVRVVDLPGYADGRPTGTLASRPVANVLARPWFIAQALGGPIAFVAGAGNVVAARAGYPKPTAQLGDIGKLYCAVAGMMNLVALMDAASRAGGREA